MNDRGDPSRIDGEVGVDLYRTDDYVQVDRIGLFPLLRVVFEPALGVSLDDVQFSLTLHPIVDPYEVSGEPAVVNLRASHGYVNVRIARDGRRLYQHWHSVREIVARPLQRLLAERVPGEKHWGFGITGPGIEGIALVRPKPRVDRAVELRAAATDQPRVFHLEEVPELEPPEARLADFGISAGPDTTEAAVRVIFTPAVYEGLLAGMPLSTDVEEGGFLIGHVLRDRERPGGYLVRVCDALPAERTGASLLRFTFTGESFLLVNDAVARRGSDERLVGWYHTHLFPATDQFGLSGVDVDLHTGTFRQRWHVAGLVNLDDATRHLRVYAWNGAGMSQLPCWVERAWTR